MANSKIVVFPEPVGAETTIGASVKILLNPPHLARNFLLIPEYNTSEKTVD